ncbi:transcription factor bHLH91-like [Nicotiana tabacum]|uniref:transcription factor bHLH91-like n=1 Tax=Nicotiana tabacum TaxID=4097 RepID=UPI003F4EF99E
MYVESDCFDPAASVQHEDVFAIEENTYQQDAAVVAAAALEMQLQQQLILEMEQCYNNTHNNNNNMQELVHEHNNQGLSCDQSNWGEMSFPPYQNQEDNNNFQHAAHDIQNGHDQQPYLPTPDLLNMFPLPRSSISFTNTNTNQASNLLTSLGLLGDINIPATADGASNPSAIYDPSLLPLNLPPQPPLLRELFHSLPHGYGLRNLRSTSSFFNGLEERDQLSGALYQDGEERPFDNGIFEFSADMNGIAKNRDIGKDTKHFATERQRRVHLNDKYKALRSMVPNPSKNDRASIVKDAIEYINELKREVHDLELMVEKKRCNRDRIKRQKTEEGGNSMDGSNAKQMDEVDQSYNGNSLRSSWLQRRSKNTEVDVRVVDHEVTIKLVQQKRINCLLFASKVLDDLQLDLHHVAGGLIGDYYSFLFNSKICEGSTVYASAIAKKLIEVVDIQYAAIAPTNSY